MLRFFSSDTLFDLEQKELHCGEAILTLLTVLLTSHFNAGWQVFENDAATRLVDLLPTLPAPARELLGNVLRTYAQRLSEREEARGEIDGEGHGTRW